MKGIIADLVTGSRIASSLLMLCFPVFSPFFYVFYLISGITDMVDGTIARKLGTESEFGSRLDTISDIIFATLALYMILPALQLPPWLWIWISVIALIKLINIISGFVIDKRFVSIHSLSNKAVGAILFILPFTVSFIDIRFSSATACLIATFASIEEGHLIRTHKTQRTRI